MKVCGELSFKLWALKLEVLAFYASLINYHGFSYIHKKALTTEIIGHQMNFWLFEKLQMTIQMLIDFDKSLIYESFGLMTAIT